MHQATAHASLKRLAVDAMCVCVICFYMSHVVGRMYDETMTMSCVVCCKLQASVKCELNLSCSSKSTKRVEVVRWY
jgi:hypothetical protein